MNMDAAAMELYLYMNSPEPIIAWLEAEQTPKTREAILQKLAPYVRSLTYSVAASIGSGRGGSFAGIPGAIKRVLAHYGIKE